MVIQKANLAKVAKKATMANNLTYKDHHQIMSKSHKMFQNQHFLV